VILYGHHEHYDGTGYPEGLKGNEIPMASRIFALVDSFVAMVAPVSEKHRKSCDEVKKEIQKYSGQQFDPFLVDMLMKIVDKEEFFTDTGREHNAATE
jgi:response regulator RpfG family c-di-GMP phosphodiesterase